MAAPASDVQQLVAFRVGDGYYALDIMRIKEIINPLPITRVPKSPSFIEGVIELRRAILPVVDLRKRFDVEPGPPQRLGDLHDRDVGLRDRYPHPLPEPVGQVTHPATLGTPGWTRPAVTTSLGMT